MKTHTDTAMETLLETKYEHYSVMKAAEKMPELAKSTMMRTTRHPFQPGYDERMNILRLRTPVFQFVYPDIQVEEYPCNSQSLQELFKEGIMTPELWDSIFTQVLAGLAVSKQQVDITPTSIVVRVNKDAKHYSVHVSNTTYMFRDIFYTPCIIGRKLDTKNNTIHSFLRECLELCNKNKHKNKYKNNYKNNYKSMRRCLLDELSVIENKDNTGLILAARSKAGITHVHSTPRTSYICTANMFDDGILPDSHYIYLYYIENNSKKARNYAIKNIEICMAKSPSMSFAMNMYNHNLAQAYLRVIPSNRIADIVLAYEEVLYVKRPKHGGVEGVVYKDDLIAYDLDHIETVSRIRAPNERKVLNILYSLVDYYENENIYKDINENKELLEPFFTFYKKSMDMIDYIHVARHISEQHKDGNMKALSNIRTTNNVYSMFMEHGTIIDACLHYYNKMFNKEQ